MQQKNLRFLGMTAALIVANAWYLMQHHNVPDGRLRFLLPMTSLIIIGVALALKKLSVNGRKESFLMWYGMSSAIAFMVFAPIVQRLFQDVGSPDATKFPLVATIPFWPYLVIFGIALVLYRPTSKILAGKDGVVRA